MIEGKETTKRKTDEQDELNENQNFQEPPAELKVDQPLSEAGLDDQQGLSAVIVPRRKFISGVAAMTGTLALSGERGLAAPWSRPLPNPAASGIKHVVVLMMENRSFDHFLGWLPGADGMQAGLTYTDRDGVAHATYPLAPEYQGCSHPDPDHSYEGGRVEFNNGACDGWLRAGDNDLFAIGYYTQGDLSFLGPQVPSWTTFDRYFAAIMAETFPNRIYQHAAQTDRLHNSFAISTLPTIWDRLAERHVDGRYYFSDVPFLALWGRKYLRISRHYTDFLDDCAKGKLPEVSFVEPRFIDEERGTSNDDHPHADIRNGEVFLDEVYQAVTSSPAWPKTVLVINYDEWGGFFDHVAPPLAPAADQAIGNDGRLGFRVPSLLIAPWARRGHVSHAVYDHTSILKLIEWRWNLAPLTVHDAAANNLADELDFSQPRLDAPRFPVPRGPFGTPCPTNGFTQSSVSSAWHDLRAVARSYGWPV
jgi:phospholipase C